MKSVWAACSWFFVISFRSDGVATLSSDAMMPSTMICSIRLEPQ